jgi:gliding motility-associated-like protein
MNSSHPMKKTSLFIYLVCFSFLANSQGVDFTYTTSDSLFCNPSSVVFTPSFPGSPNGFVWTFGNGTGSNSQNPTTIYSSSGSFTVKLIVIYQRTTLVVTKTIVINPSVTTTIGFDRNYICQPGVINFTGLGGGNISSYQWDFGDGSTLNSGSNAAPHSYSSLGVYNVTLKATNSTGCFDTSQTTIKVQTIPVTGSLSPGTGCIPANVTFKANASIPVNSNITNYTWNFGDGSPGVATASNNMNHIYSAAGNYSPNVTVTTNEGCVSTFKLTGVAYGTPPTNEMAYPVSAVFCGSDSGSFVSKAIKANSYTWNFGDGTTATVNDTIAHHKYVSLGTKNVIATPAYNGCNGSAATFQVKVIGVIATYGYSNTCSDKQTFAFTNRSQGNLSTVTWDFGDGTPILHSLNATHIFPLSGSFITTLTITDSITGCSDSSSRTIYTSQPSLEDIDSSICKNSTTTFSVKNDFNNPSATYTWHVVGQQIGPLNDSSLAVKTTLFGNFNNFVVIDNGVAYCKDTFQLNHTILVRGPVLNFTAPSSLCLSIPYTVINSSKPYLASDSVDLWTWDYADHSKIDSVYQPQPHQYGSAQGYGVKLSATDINGCQDSLVKTVIVHPLPFLYVIPATDTLCAGTADTLFAFHNGNIRWTPSNSLTCGNCDTVLTKATTNTTYYITDTTQFGCSITDSVIVEVYSPFTAVPLVADAYVCLNDTIHLNVDPPGEKIVWSPAGGLSNPNNYGPIASPSQPTTYTATLTDSVGCFTSSTSINIHVKALPTVDAGPDQSYPYNSPFSINPKYSNNISTYNWTPGNLLSCTACADPSGVATSSNTFFIKVTSDSGCVAKDSVTIFVECKDAYLLMPNAFTPNNDNLNDYFYPLTRGIKSITRFSIYDRMGNLVYEAKNFPPNDKTYGWDGKIKGSDQSTAVFVYYLEAVCDLGEKLYKRGSVVLVR